MKVRSLISRYTPEYIKRKIRSKIKDNEMKSFNSLRKINCDAKNLRRISSLTPDEIFNSLVINSDWHNSKTNINKFILPDGTGGVNPGDRRAIYYLINYFKPFSVLEIGTHIGASTIHIATAQNDVLSNNPENVQLTTIDIRDVNSKFEKPWLMYGAGKSPSEMIKELNLEKYVSFMTGGSLKYMNETNQKFDFIFLDGSHTASMVYQEIPAALKLLNPDGVILLHDYFPENEPLWSDKPAISGPYLAAERLINEGADLTVLPLDELPWKTKLNSNITSLALLFRN